MSVRKHKANLEKIFNDNFKSIEELIEATYHPESIVPKSVIPGASAPKGNTYTVYGMGSGFGFMYLGYVNGSGQYTSVEDIKNKDFQDARTAFYEVRESINAKVVAKYHDLPDIKKWIFQSLDYQGIMYDIFLPYMRENVKMSEKRLRNICIRSTED